MKLFAVGTRTKLPPQRQFLVPRLVSPKRFNSTKPCRASELHQYMRDMSNHLLLMVIILHYPYQQGYLFVDKWLFNGYLAE
ncbi:hypothetical protein KIN20_027868 [Parelaphostrongylus tenuis]|uniref:Uncharacterized protein n=1 Tax=Parelaphostrongylus tenuis TaxID=148309 RepID=A0AAD5QZX1_PARTN|nr:hypothetical protein KIN20_027868 [Parelaphostrongylus tenuis]